MINTLISKFKEILATEEKKFDEIASVMLSNLHGNINGSTDEILKKIDEVEDRYLELRS